MGGSGKGRGRERGSGTGRGRARPSYHCTPIRIRTTRFSTNIRLIRTSTQPPLRTLTNTRTHIRMHRTSIHTRIHHHVHVHHHHHAGSGGAPPTSTSKRSVLAAPQSCRCQALTPGKRSRAQVAFGEQTIWYGIVGREREREGERERERERDRRQPLMCCTRRLHLPDTSRLHLSLWDTNGRCLRRSPHLRPGTSSPATRTVGGTTTTNTWSKSRRASPPTACALPSFTPKLALCRHQRSRRQAPASPASPQPHTPVQA